MDGESHPALLLVDGVSSIGGLNFEFDKWKVDVAITGSQKALSLPTGLCVLAVSDKVGQVFLRSIAALNVIACCSGCLRTRLVKPTCLPPRRTEGSGALPLGWLIMETHAQLADHFACLNSCLGRSWLNLSSHQLQQYNEFSGW